MPRSNIWILHDLEVDFTRLQSSYDSTGLDNIKVISEFHDTNTRHSLGTVNTKPDSHLVPLNRAPTKSTEHILGNKEY